MLLTDELIGRIHQVNLQGLRSAAEAAASVRADAAYKEIAGGIACFAGEGSPFTQLTEYGHGSAAAELEEVEDFFADRCQNWEITVTPLANSNALGALGQAGYVPHHFESVLAMEIAEIPLAGEVEIEEVSRGSADWMMAAERGWSENDACEDISETTRIAASMDGTRLYLARVGGVPAAAASMVIGDGLVCLSGATTRIPYRGRGLQTALIARRLGDAGPGALALMTAMPGTASHRNAQRRGFQPLYSKLVFMRR